MIKYGLFVALILMGCQLKEAQLEFSMDHEQFLDILRDIHYAEAALENLKLQEKDSLKVQFYTHILRYHDVTKEQLEEAMEQLRSDPVYLNQVYKELYTKISNN